jgi:polysaccharide pyruvyl transferase WcaK-like protein
MSRTFPIRSGTLLGSSSGRNAGDAALMSGIMDMVDQACGTPLTWEIPTIAPAFVRGNYANRVKPVGMLPWNLAFKFFGVPTYRSMARTDMSLVFDAVLFDRSLYNPLFNFLSTLHAFVPSIRRKGRLLGCFDVGAGPIDTPAGARMLRRVGEQMDFITVRDQGSLDVFRDVGLEHPRLLITADAAINCPAAPAARVDELLDKMGLPPGKEFLAININKYLDTCSRPRPKQSPTLEKFLGVYAEALNQVADQLGVPLLFVSTQHHDIEITQALMARVNKGPKHVFFGNHDHTHYEVKGVLNRAALLFAMRLHALILASSGLAPVSGIAYQPKCSYYFDVLGLAPHMLEFKDYNAERLRDHVLMSWGQRAAIRDRLGEVMPRLRLDAARPARLIAALHAGQDLDTAWRSIQ